MEGVFGEIRFCKINGVSMAVKSIKSFEDKISYKEQLNEYILRKYLPETFNYCVGRVDKCKLVYPRMDMDSYDSLKNICNQSVCDDVDMKNYFEQCVTALYDIHSRMITHNDIKSDNIMIKDGKVKLIDAGGCTIRSLMPHYNNYSSTESSKAMRMFRGDKLHNKYLFNCFSIYGKKYFLQPKHINVNSDVFALANLFMCSLYWYVTKIDTFSKFIVFNGDLYICSNFDNGDDHSIDDFVKIDDEVVQDILTFDVGNMILLLLNVDNNISAKRVLRYLDDREEVPLWNSIFTETYDIDFREHDEYKSKNFLLDHLRNCYVRYTDDEIFNLLNYLRTKKGDLGDLEYYDEVCDYISDDTITLDCQTVRSFDFFINAFDTYKNKYSLNTIFNLFLYPPFRRGECTLNVIHEFAVPFYNNAIPDGKIKESAFEDDIVVINFMNHLAVRDIDRRLGGMSDEKSFNKMINEVYDIINIITSDNVNFGEYKINELLN